MSLLFGCCDGSADSSEIVDLKSMYPDLQRSVNTILGELHKETFLILANVPISSGQCEVNLIPVLEKHWQKLLSTLQGKWPRCTGYGGWQEKFNKVKKVLLWILVGKSTGRLEQMFGFHEAPLRTFLKEWDGEIPVEKDAFRMVKQAVHEASRHKTPKGTDCGKYHLLVLALWESRSDQAPFWQRVMSQQVTALVDDATHVKTWIGEVDARLTCMIGEVNARLTCIEAHVGIKRKHEELSACGSTDVSSNGHLDLCKTDDQEDAHRGVAGGVHVVQE